MSKVKLNFSLTMMVFLLAGCDGGAGDMDRAIQELQGAQNKQKIKNTSKAPALYKSDYMSGLDKICIYNRLGSEEAYTFKATDNCPLKIP